VVEYVLMQQVRLVEQKHRVEALTPELLDVCADGAVVRSCFTSRGSRARSTGATRLQPRSAVFPPSGRRSLCCAPESGCLCDVCGAKFFHHFGGVRDEEKPGQSCTTEFGFLRLAEVAVRRIHA